MFAVGRRCGRKAHGMTEHLTGDCASHRLHPPGLCLTRGTNKLLSHAWGRADFGFTLLAIRLKVLANLSESFPVLEREELLSEGGDASLLNGALCLGCLICSPLGWVF